MKKRLIPLLLSIILIISGCGDATDNEGSPTADSNKQDDTPIELIWWTYAPDGTAPDDAQEVLKAVNEISKEKIGVTVKMIYKSDSEVRL